MIVFISIEYFPAGGRNIGDYGKPKVYTTLSSLSSSSYYYHHKNKKHKKLSTQQQILSPLKYNTGNDNFDINDYDDIAKIDDANDIYITDIADDNDINNNNTKRLRSPIRRRWDPHFHVSYLSSSIIIIINIIL